MNKVERAGQALRRIALNLWHLPPTLHGLSQRFGRKTLNLPALRRVVVFPSLGLAYNRIKKNANTSAVILLRQLESGTVEQRADAKWNVRSFLDLSSAERASLSRLHFFVIIRNPYSRVLSAFLDKFRHAHYRRRHGDFPLTPQGFQDFVRWLAQGGLAKDPHWDLQTKLLLVPLTRFDTVIRFETLRDDFLALLRARGARPPAGSLEDLYPSDKDKRTDSDAKLQGFYTAETATMVARLYARDFAELGYTTAFPAAAPAEPRREASLKEQA